LIWENVNHRNVGFRQRRPSALPAFHPKNGLLYISTELENSISIVDPKALKVVGSVPTGKPDPICLSYLTMVDGLYRQRRLGGRFQSVDLEANSLVTVIEAAPRVQLFLFADDRWV